ncbi:uncharacterized protein LOC106865794 [Brachypodium distachyon]|uniref:Uncharacterized protein n=1 Tax=Brachypodium distachyon TaxID=15368 RepID=A0A0Q3KZ14_BRADI|nr:uncharacterized protein LOC106865794 [Brachypodium distachyon]KQK16377.1 hypothetical protein BRADI_1g28458v3 [Brachypodium distachyon]|eukprot:XP_014752093.1 uncharacterized protein LOC106865794 [Brachypodium distachyon]
MIVFLDAPLLPFPLCSFPELLPSAPSLPSSPHSCLSGRERRQGVRPNARFFIGSRGRGVCTREMAGEENKAAEDKAGKSQQPIASTAATTTATAGDSDSSVNSSLPGGARPSMASFPRLAAAAASSSMNYNVQQSVTKAIPGHGQTGHEHGDTLGTQQGRNADRDEHWARIRRGHDATVAAGNLKRQRLRGNFGFGHGQPPPHPPQQSNTRGPSSAAPTTLNLLNREPPIDVDAPLMCLACKTMPMRQLPDPRTMHHCVCEDCFKAGSTACPQCRQSSSPAQEKSAVPQFEAALQPHGQSSSSAALLQMLPQAGQASSQAPPVPDVQPTAAVGAAANDPNFDWRTLIVRCWECDNRVAPWTTYCPNVQEHRCVCETCFNNGSTACLFCSAANNPNFDWTTLIVRCWECDNRAAPFTTYYPNVQEHLCVCETCFNNGSTACLICPCRR